jgi:hypothetical protein
MLEQKEKERVMKLMDRLENMKRNVSQSNSGSTNKCSLCGDYFYSLRSLPNQCSLCKKILCAKCCIDTPSANGGGGGGDCSSSNNSSRRNSFSNNNSNSEAGNGGSRGGVVYLCRLCSEQREVGSSCF